jgi:hypothetical protein
MTRRGSVCHDMVETGLMILGTLGLAYAAYGVADYFRNDVEEATWLWKRLVIHHFYGGILNDMINIDWREVTDEEFESKVYWDHFSNPRVPLSQLLPLLDTFVKPDWVIRGDVEQIDWHRSEMTDEELVGAEAVEYASDDANLYE